jgi:hypothetical protein
MPQNGGRRPLESHPEGCGLSLSSSTPQALYEPRADSWSAGRPDLSRAILWSRTGGPALVGAITRGWGHRSARAWLLGMIGSTVGRE